MIQTTRGIVLNTIEYKETSQIIKVYTATHGLQSFLVSNVRKKKSKFARSLFQPLALVEIVANIKQQSSIHRATEVTASPVLQSIPFDPIKSSIAFFLGEVLSKSIREEEPNQELFHFIDHSIQILDVNLENTSRFHLCFLVQLSKYFGFFPNGKLDKVNKYFDLKEGIFVAEIPHHPFYLNEENSKIFYQLSTTTFEDLSQLKINAIDRKFILESIIMYYELHHLHGSTIRSYSILNEVMS